MPLIGSYKQESPCLDCKDRWISEEGRCHGSCERYLKFKTDAEQFNRLVNQERARQRKNLIRDGKTASQLNRIEKARKR